MIKLHDINLCHIDDNNTERIIFLYKNKRYGDKVILEDVTTISTFNFNSNGKFTQKTTRD